MMYPNLRSVWLALTWCITLVLLMPASAQCWTVDSWQTGTAVPTAARDSVWSAGREDSLVLAEAVRVIFKVNSTTLAPADRARLVREVVPRLKALGPHGVAIVRSAASPEGPYDNNRRLAIGRREAIKAVLESEGVETSRLCYEMAVEEYVLLVELMRQRRDPDYLTVRTVVDSLRGDDVATKAALMSVDDGALFKRLTADYFPELRAAHVFIRQTYGIEASLLPCVVKASPATIGTLSRLDNLASCVPLSRMRREWLSVRTNLLEYAAYVPKYGWCPMPNGAVEFYPRRGHFTFGADFDCPWWVGNTTNHKYFELNNYTLETRYYFRSSARSYDASGLPNGQAAFKHFYLSAYGNAYLYQIGCNADDGWIGEGWGAGGGLGYVLPLGRKAQHWRLDFGVNFGILRTQYDPFVYGCPVDGTDDGRYYYNYVGRTENFKRRQYHFTWVGPTRLSLSLSYDLLYRRNHGRGISFRSREQKGGEP